MHFFLNKSGWHPEFGWFHQNYLTYDEIKHIWQEALAHLGPRNWHPNMAETCRAVINPAWEALGPEFDAFAPDPYKPIYVGPLPKRLQNNPDNQTKSPLG